MKNRHLRTFLATGLLAGALAVAGCSAGYPSTEDRIEAVDETIKESHLSGSSYEARDKRFDKDVLQSPAVPAAPVTPPKK